MTDFEPKQYRDQPKMICRYLNDALRTDDPTAIGTAILNVIRAQNVVALSRETGLARENLYRVGGGTRVSTLLKVLSGMGVQLVVEPRTSPKTKAPRPKLGRPKSKPGD
jgi:probable addiction module antidote protein